MATRLTLPPEFQTDHQRPVKDQVDRRSTAETDKSPETIINEFHGIPNLINLQSGRNSLIGIENAIIDSIGCIF